jgi:ATP-binding cassette subfamily F protein 3
MGFGAQKIDTPVEKLSGGEKVRLLLGLMAFEKPHVLILDEPTSHLDIDSREALIVALNDYDGAVLLITHDVYLAEAIADRLWLVHDGRASQYDGDLSDYRDLVLSADRPVDRAERDQHHTPAPKAAEKKASAYTAQQRLSAAEADLEQAQAALARIDAALADPALYARDPAKAGALARDRDGAADALARAEEAWLKASEALT